jgi:hypothetical protein
MSNKSTAGMRANDNTEHKATLDDVSLAMKCWRETKKNPGDPMPDEMWLNIFKLADMHSEKRVRIFLGITSIQYAERYRKLSPKLNSPKTPDTPTAFCEASIAPDRENQTRSSVQTLRSNKPALESYIDTSTIIVECIKPDGHRIKIHAVQKNIREIMLAFFDAGDIL